MSYVIPEVFISTSFQCFTLTNDQPRSARRRRVQRPSRPGAEEKAGRSITDGIERRNRSSVQLQRSDRRGEQRLDFLQPQKDQLVTVEQGDEDENQADDGAGRARRAELASELDAIRGDRSIHGDEGENPRGRVLRPIGDEGVKTTSDRVDVAQGIVPSVFDHQKEIEKARVENEKVHQREKSEVAEGRRTTQRAVREDHERNEIAEGADYEKKERTIADETRIEAVDGWPSRGRRR